MSDGVGNAKTRSKTLRCLVLTTHSLIRNVVLNQVPTEEEALTNIADAAREYMEVAVAEE